jgi:hypothetical protein
MSTMMWKMMEDWVGVVAASVAAAFTAGGT